MPSPTITYPLDLTGINPASQVKNELHTVNEGMNSTYYFIVPDFAPFYIDNFKASIIVNNVSRPMVEDVDFSFALSYVTGTRTTGKAMYGAITLHNLEVSGIINLECYQTVGGDQVADKLEVLTILADKAYNPRTTIWDILTNVPNAFPPLPHYQDYDSFYGQEEVVNALGGIRDALLQNSALTQAKIQAFLDALNIGNLNNYVKKVGDTMTGALTLSGPPTSNMHAVNKKYVDDNAITVDALTSRLGNYYPSQNVDQFLLGKVSKSGDTMTGPLLLSGNPTQASQAANKAYIDSLILNLQNQFTTLETTVTNVQNGYVTKEYVDAKFDELYSYITSLSILR